RRAHCDSSVGRRAHAMTGVRAELLPSLDEKLRDGQTILLLGPSGMGKTAVLSAIFERARRAGIPAGFAQRTATLGDVVGALREAYPSVVGSSAKQLHARLRSAIDARPGILFLDHVIAASAATRGFLKSLRGKKLGVLLAGDVDHPREKLRLRSFGL